MAREKAIVLLSGGLDSAFNLWRGRRDYEIVLGLTFDYGQRAARSEIQAADRLLSSSFIPHKILDLKWFTDFTKTALVNRRELVPVGLAVSIDEFERSTETAKAVWVPNRNGVFLNIAAAYAEGLGASVILTGFNAEEALTFPDNSIAYRETLNECFRYSTANGVRVESFCSNMNKTEIVKAAIEIDLPFQWIWPCYFSGDEWCGQCESCLRFQRAMRATSQTSSLGPGAEL